MEEKQTNFYTLPERPKLAREEEKILDFWHEIDAFQTQLKKSEGQPPYTFYDGPPFATGLPHYGHICAGTIKDVVTRYATQTGHYVSRRFGWDCHGLPIEYEIDKELGIKCKEDYAKIGIAEYNKKCRGIVMRYSSEWERIIERAGRWIDFKNNYKTMDTSYMESIWWAFKQIYDQGMVYRGCRVMPFSTACNTVLSNFEAGSNYKEVWDPSIWLTFPLEKDPSVKLVAWTTTPWTLPSNLALAVNPDFDYLKYRDLKTNEVYIAAKCRMGELYPEKKDQPKEYEVLETMKGSELEGLSYIPLFDYFIKRKEDGCFKVITADFVTDDTGTGVVHCAPAFGEEDYRICVKKGIIKPDNPACPVNENGCFTSEVKDFEGIYVKTADKDIKKLLKSQGRLIHESQIKHSYPFCWRSDTPLIYRAQHSWFIKVTSIKDQMLENNKKSYWVPKFAQEKRFHNWLENAEDWCFSRSRIWGNPIPLWASDDFEEIVCVGSIQELKDLSGWKEEITDLHREFIDHITIPSKQGKGLLHRIPEIFDCWFESGSMPFAQSHYPFEMSEEDFQKQFPGDFIAEGIDQTRGWFYTLLVISTAVKKSHTFKNLIVNGIVLAADGKKMSKRLKNYPDPKEVIIDNYGADAMRLYLMNSCLVKGETLNFKEEGVKDVVKDIFLPWYNANRFLIQNISRFEKKQNKKFLYNEKIVEQYDSLKNSMDKWIISQSEELITLVREEMAKYKLYKVVPKLVIFLEQLTNWHVRLNRRRLKGDTTAEDWEQGLTILFDVILKSAILMACYVPFITELFYKNLVKCIPKESKYFEQSIHFLRIPEANLKAIDKDNQERINVLFKCIDLGRCQREKAKLSFKQPIASCTVLHKSEQFLAGFQHLTHYIKDELNCKEIFTSDKIESYIEYSALPDNKLLGKRLGKSFKNLAPKLRALTPEQITTYMKDKKIAIDGVDILENELITSLKFKLQEQKENQLIDGEEGLCVILDGHQTEEMKNEGLTREFTNRIQKLRKKAALNQDDEIIIFVNIQDKEFFQLIQSNLHLVNTIIQKPVQYNCEAQEQFKEIIQEKTQVNNVEVEIKIFWNNVWVCKDKIKETFGEKAEELFKILICYEVNQLKAVCAKNNYLDGVFSVTMNNEKFELKEKEHFQLY